jgi:hypothetical protein
MLETLQNIFHQGRAPRLVTRNAYLCKNDNFDENILNNRVIFLTTIHSIAVEGLKNFGLCSGGAQCL